jgi:hypothetical protein
MSDRFVSATGEAFPYTAVLGSSVSNAPSKFIIEMDTKGLPTNNGMQGNLFSDFWLGNNIADSARWTRFTVDNGEANRADTWRVGFDDNALEPAGLGRDLIGILDKVQFNGGNAHQVPEPSCAWMLCLGLAGIGIAGAKKRHIQ